MFYLYSSLKSIPDISKSNNKNINNINSVFENCSSLNFIPNISKWKFNKKIEINNIFKGCNSLLIIPDISKWNIIIPPECFSISSFNSNSIDIKTYSSNLSEDLSFLKNRDNKDKTNTYENINSINFFNNNDELDDYYDNFYN